MEIPILALVGGAVGILASIAAWVWVRKLTRGLPKPPAGAELRSNLDLAGRMQHASRVRAELRRAGQTVEARVVHIQDTRERWANAPVMDVAVRLLTGNQREVTLQEAIPITICARLEPGDTVRLLTDPSKPEQFAFDWG